MRLVLTKNQSKRVIGGVSFEVDAQVELTDEERNLVEHYNMHNMVLLSRPLVTIWGKPSDQQVEVTVKDLLGGEAFKCKDLSEVVAYSDGLKEACRNFKTYMDVARGFRGQETIDY